MTPASPIEFATQEILCVHALCDRAGVPREMNEELLSMSQRVAVLERCYAGMVLRLGMDYVSTQH